MSPCDTAKWLWQALFRHFNNTRYISLEEMQIYPG